ncbi:Small, acid-soluble spore protein, alpha/beta type [Paenibacillus sp. UNCCL117]|nr:MULTISPECIES: small, acid-soluble spore protein, alpha/beta type [unclassified Paenibacillus]SDE53420.1 Small, acid-soluble spore protein, alpha/beta type [Paenibacillus sp. cl123]SFW68017.1 Small, acid-soluble spore protein, alpha/beta type [Paenibacillus sp. UNCCL117]
MGRRNRRGVMSEQFKYELAKDLGFYETVEREGWGGIKTKDAGNMVKRAIQIAEQTLANQTAASMPRTQQPANRMSAQMMETQPYNGSVPRAMYPAQGELRTPPSYQQSSYAQVREQAAPIASQEAGRQSVGAFVPPGFPYFAAGQQTGQQTSAYLP